MKFQFAIGIILGVVPDFLERRMAGFRPEIRVIQQRRDQNLGAFRQIDVLEKFDLPVFNDGANGVQYGIPPGSLGDTVARNHEL